MNKVIRSIRILRTFGSIIKLEYNYNNIYNIKSNQ